MLKFDIPEAIVTGEWFALSGPQRGRRDAPLASGHVGPHVRLRRSATDQQRPVGEEERGRERVTVSGMRLLTIV